MPRARVVLSLALLALFSGAGCAGLAANPPAPSVALGPTSADLSAVAATLDRFHAAAAAADEATYFAQFADGGVFLGTDGAERWTVPELRAYAHPHFAGGKAWSFRSARRFVSVRGDTAWFDEDLETDKLGPARGSGVLVRDGGGPWRIAQYNLSVPIPNARFGEVRRLLEGGGR
jgi:hypothetical protein